MIIYQVCKLFIDLVLIDHKFVLVGTLLSLLIQQNDFPETTPKLGACYAMYDIFLADGQQLESPFTPFLFNLVENNTQIKLNVVERNFIIQLLTNGTKDVKSILFLGLDHSF